MNIEITKITSKGQVVIPQGMRKNKGIKEGERFLIYDVDDSIVLKRINNLEKTKSREEFEEVFKSMWKTAKERNITEEDVKNEIIAYRKEKHAKGSS